MIADRAGFIRANTHVLSPPLVPELRLHLAHEAVPLWIKSEAELGVQGLPPPFWAFAWAGGQALARHVLDHPAAVRGKAVLDLAAGSGLVGIAAAKAGAATVLSADIDPFAVAACRLNMALNHVELRVVTQDLLDRAPHGFETILVGDFFYERSTADRAIAWLSDAARLGALVLIGDPGRCHLPKDRLSRIADYCVPVTRELEDADIKRTSIWRLAL